MAAEGRATATTHPPPPAHAPDEPRQGTAGTRSSAPDQPPQLVPLSTHIRSATRDASRRTGSRSASHTDLPMWHTHQPTNRAPGPGPGALSLLHTNETAPWCGSWCETTGYQSRQLKPDLTSVSAGQRGGAEGTRTPDPLTASQMRYQLRHSPLRRQRYTTAPAASRRGPVAQLPAMAVCSQSESRDVDLAAADGDGRGAELAVGLQGRVRGGGLGRRGDRARRCRCASTHCVKSPGRRPAPCRTRRAGPRSGPALPSAGCSSNSRSW